MKNSLFFVSAATTETEADAAIRALVQQVETQAKERLGEGPPQGWIDLAIVFVSAHFTYAIRQVVDGIQAELRPVALLGCTAEGVVGSEQEIEEMPAITLVAAHLPGAQVSPFLLQPPDTDWHKLLLDSDEFRRTIDAPQDTRLFILLGDPFSAPMDDVLQAFNSNYGGIPVVGGMASGALRPGGNALWTNDQVIHEGALGVSISGAVDVDVVVSQGCRPIWRPFKVVSAHRNIIFNLEGRPPLAWLQDLIPELSDDDRALLQNGLFVGCSIKPGQEQLGRGDFIIRGVVGVDQQSGAIAIGDSVMDGETIQFHLRDALTAQEDLEMMLIPQTFRPIPSGALLFLCNGRGTRLYDHPNGDISVIQANLEGTPLAGFFCAGEIGPIGGTNFLHGHTASLVFFRPLSLLEE
jgi:small ligand-binding sensory domain FIST